VDCNFAAPKSREMPDARLNAAALCLITSIFAVLIPIFAAPPDCRPGAPLLQPPRYSTDRMWKIRMWPKQKINEKSN